VRTTSLIVPTAATALCPSTSLTDGSATRWTTGTG